MKRSILLVVASAIALTACNTQNGGNASVEAHEGSGLGITPAWMDKAVVPGDDFFSYADGTWVKNTALVNTDPEGEGWFFKLKLDNPGELDGLMDESAYRDWIKTL